MLTAITICCTTTLVGILSGVITDNITVLKLAGILSIISTVLMLTKVVILINQ